MHAKMIFIVMSIGIEAGNVWRALFVAALAVSVFALNRYWQSLETRTLRVRLSLIILRAASLLLLLSALAGLRLDYQRGTPGRVLVHYVQNRFAGAEENNGRSSVEDAAIERTVASLRRSGFEPVVSKDLHAVPGSEEQNQSFAAAVLLTDAALGATAARREVERVGAAAGDAPVFVVTELAPAATPSVALESLMLQGRPVRGVPVTLRCTVHGRGMSGHESLLTISDAARVQASARVTWTSDNQWQTVSLEVVPKIAGWMDYVARIEPAGGEDAALLTRTLTLFTEERRMRVLFFEGEPTWEAKFIRRALEQSGLFDLDYFAQVSRAATLGAATAAAGAQSESESVDQSGQQSAGKALRVVASPEAKLHAALQSAASLNAYDLVIVGATPNAMLSAAEAARLSSFVEQRGGGLVITGGNSFAGSAPAPNGRLYALMPADVDPRGFASETQQVAQGAPLEAEKTRGQRALVPTEAGAVGPLGGYLSASEGTLSAVLTGQGLSLRGLRPGAVVLATSGQSGGGAAVANNAGGGSVSVPLVAAMRYGAGRVLVFAPADSWRIRTSATGAQDEQSGPYGALWQGIALWTTEGARPQVEIVLDTESPAVGQQVTAELRVRDPSFAPLNIQRVKARLQPLQAEEAGEAETATNESDAHEILFVPDTVEENVWRASFIAPARGRFSLEAEFAANQKRGSTEKRFAIVAPTRMEAGASTDTLRRAARSSGGEMFSAAQLNNLLEVLSRHTQTAPTTEQRTWELRTWPPLAFLLALLLSAEWLIGRMKAEG